MGLVPYSVRPAGPKDLPSVVGVLARRPDAANAPVAQLHEAMWARMLATPDLTVYVAEDTGATSWAPRRCWSCPT